MRVGGGCGHDLCRPNRICYVDELKMRQQERRYMSEAHKVRLDNEDFELEFKYRFSPWREWTWFTGIEDYPRIEYPSHGFSIGYFFHMRPHLFFRMQHYQNLTWRVLWILWFKFEWNTTWGEDPL